MPGKGYKGVGEKVTLTKLLTADSRAYIELCEKAGFLSTAFYFYSKQPNEKDLEHALGIATQLKGISSKTITSILEKLEKEYKRRLDLPSFVTGRGSWGDAYAYISYQERQKEYKGKLNNLPNLAAGFGLTKGEDGRYFKTKTHKSTTT